MKAEEFNPLGDRLLVKPDAAEEKVGGVFLPAGAQEKPLTATVVATGSDVDVELSKGDKVLYSKYGGLEVSTEEGPHLILRVGDVLGTVGKQAF